MIKIVAVSTLKPGVLQDYLQAAAELIEKSNQEEGCISYQIYQDKNDETKVAMFEAVSYTHLDVYKRQPYGETRTYRQIAEKTGNPKACRAVGAANSRNPIWIMIPCHRVIGKDGGLTGYAGGLDKKSFLLDLERKNSGEK